MKKIKSTIVVNFKKLTGKEALDLAERLNKFDGILRNKYDIILAVQAPDVNIISQYCKFEIFVQDTFSEEKNCFLTFFTNNDYKKDHNIAGVILNHPEKKLSTDLLRSSIKKAKELNIKILICATTIEEAVELNKYDPHYIGIESEALIGKNESFLNHCPEIVQQAKLKINTNILIGAGIKTSQDFKHVINAGGSGVLVSSLILKSNDPLHTLNEFLN
jgi:triosephosphate isomerase